MSVHPTALLGLSGCDAEPSGGRVELVRAVHALRGRGPLPCDGPSGCEVTKVSLLGPARAPAMPAPEAGADKMFVVSPFLDASTVRKTAQWGGTESAAHARCDDSGNPTALAGRPERVRGL